MKYKIGFLRLVYWFHWYSFKLSIKSILKQVKDCLMLFIIVFLVMGTPVWLGYLFGIITNQAWCYAMATGYLFFWNVVPCTPYVAMCVAITLGIHKLKLIIKGS